MNKRSGVAKAIIQFMLSDAYTCVRAWTQPRPKEAIALTTAVGRILDNVAATHPKRTQAERDADMKFAVDRENIEGVLRRYYSLAEINVIISEVLIKQKSNIADNQENRYN